MGLVRARLWRVRKQSREPSATEGPQGRAAAAKQACPVPAGGRTTSPNLNPEAKSWPRPGRATTGPSAGRGWGWGGCRRSPERGTPSLSASLRPSERKPLGRGTAGGASASCELEPPGVRDGPLSVLSSSVNLNPLRTCTFTFEWKARRFAKQRADSQAHNRASGALAARMAGDHLWRACVHACTCVRARACIRLRACVHAPRTHTIICERTRVCVRACARVHTRIV